MKALITLIVLALIAWGAWYFIWGKDSVDSASNPAAANESYNFGAEGEVQGDVDLSDFEVKG